MAYNNASVVRTCERGEIEVTKGPAGEAEFRPLQEIKRGILGVKLVISIN